MELSLNAIMYDNSLERPKGCKESGVEKTSYPGFDKIKGQLVGAAQTGSVIKYNGKTFVFRYNANGGWAFGGYNAADAVFAISRQGDDLYQYQIIESGVASKGREGSWSLQKTTTPGIEESKVNKKIVDFIQQAAKEGKNDG